MKPDIQVLPFRSNKSLLPHIPTRIVGKPQRGALMLEQISISAVGTAGGSRDWILNDMEINGVSRLEVKDLSGLLFSQMGDIAVCFRRSVVIEQESEVALTVTYVGSNPDGASFFGAITGDSPPQRPTVLPIVTKNKVLPCGASTITAVLDRPLAIDRLEVDGTGTAGGAADWIVNVIRVDGTSQMDGDIPGDVFATTAIDGFVKFQPGTQIELIVTYIGLEESGCAFTGRFLGTVVRDNLEQPPPDVRAIIRTSGHALKPLFSRLPGMGKAMAADAPAEQTYIEEVIAHCNWRAPYVQSGT